LQEFLQASNFRHFPHNPFNTVEPTVPLRYTYILQVKIIANIQVRTDKYFLHTLRTTIISKSRYSVILILILKNGRLHQYNCFSAVPKTNKYIYTIVIFKDIQILLLNTSHPGILTLLVFLVYQHYQ